MDILYLIESEIAVLFLNATLCIYLKLIYSGTNSGQHMFIQYCYMVTVSSVVEVLCSMVLVTGSPYPVEARYLCSVLQQISIISVNFMFMRYIGSFGNDSTFRKKMFYVQNIVLGVFLYLELIGVFTGANFAISENRNAITTGAIWPLLHFWAPTVFMLWAWFEIYLYRTSFTQGQIWGLVIDAALSWLVEFIRNIFFPDIPSLSFVILSVNLYVFFFLLETPAYRDLERTLERLRKAKALADEANKIAQQADAAKGEFLANMSHEIRTPLTTILGMDEIILRKYEEGPIYEYARDINSAGNTLLHIINDILDFTKIESGQLELSSRNYNLGRVVRDVENMIKIKAEQKGLKYIPNVDQNLPDELFGDRIRVHQIMVNILNNAVKYTKHGSVKFTLTGERSDDPSSITLNITVADTGIGIHKEDIPKLFKSFQRIDAAQTHKIEGTGLGLAITGRLIELMGGTVEVTSTYGVGTTFLVTLPQKIVGTKTLRDYEIESTHAKKEVRKVFQAPDARVLIVDDNDMNRIVLQSLMKETKVKVDQADSGEECLKKVAQNPYDVILMDYMMPHMDGKETLANIKQMVKAPGATAKVIVCTANAIVGVRAELLAAGFDDFLSKPVKGQELEEMLIKYIPSEKILKEA